MLRIFLVIWLAITPLFAWAGSMTLLGVGTPPTVAATYTGPGDLVSGAFIWGSCARAYTAAYANGTNPLCDLVDAATSSVPICTLRVKTNGFVDLTGAYCVGSTTPAVACAAAAGGFCRISQIYDETGHSNNLTPQDGSPQLTFSTLGGLPGIQCSQANIDLMVSPAITQAQPLTFSTVYERTANFTNVSLILGNPSGAQWGTLAGAPNIFAVSAVSFDDTAASDSVFHAIQSVVNGASSNIVVDGTPTTVSPGTTGYSATALRFCRGSTTMDGFVMEVGIWPSAFNSTQYGNMNSNQHGSANGYNF